MESSGVLQTFHKYLSDHAYKCSMVNISRPLRTFLSAQVVAVTYVQCIICVAFSRSLCQF